MRYEISLPPSQVLFGTFVAIASSAVGTERQRSTVVAIASSASCTVNAIVVSCQRAWSSEPMYANATFNPSKTNQQNNELVKLKMGPVTIGPILTLFV